MGERQLRVPGREQVVSFLSTQRDLYAYLHDQTLRLLNQGHTGVEIAELIELPPALNNAWSTHGYYGSVSHNVKAIYQRYMGWFDGNPARLWPHPPGRGGPPKHSSVSWVDVRDSDRSPGASRSVTPAG